MEVSWTDRYTKCQRGVSLLPQSHHDIIASRCSGPKCTDKQEDQWQQRQQQGLIWYFAYGSNMSTDKFTRDRGIVPIATANVELPGWCLTMEVPGLPYSEPGMSSIARHEVLYPSPPRPTTRTSNPDLLATAAVATGAADKRDDDLWVKEKIPASRQQNVVGVAYLVTQQQHISIIRSEGGGIAYDDVELDAVGITERDRNILLGYGGDGEGNVKVRTLVNVPSMSRRGREPLPSERYKGLLVTGAAEAGLPETYQEMLNEWPAFVAPARRVVRSFREDIEDGGESDDDENMKRWLGALIFLAIWGPLLAGMEKLTYRYIRDEDGLAPRWVKWVVRAAVWVIWWNHDIGFAPIFGRGDGREDLDPKPQNILPRANRQDWQYKVGYRRNVLDCEKSHLPGAGESVSKLQGQELVRSKNGTKAFWTSLS